MLEITLKEKDIQNAFKNLTKTDNEKVEGLLIKFNLIDYRFEKFQASIKLQITVRQGENVLWEQTYSDSGASQGGKSFWGGAFAFKNAIQQSTKNAVDKILSQFLQELQGKVKP